MSCTRSCTAIRMTWLLSKAARSISCSQTKKELFELLFLLFPIIFIIFFNQLFLFAEKVFLAQVSTQMMEAAVAIGYLAQIFQGAFVAMAMMAQVFVGRKHGAGEWGQIGPVIWQWIWFALLSLLISVPGNLIYGRYYLAGTEIASMAWPYFYLIVCTSFLYPLGTVLCSFFLGQKKTRLVFFGCLGCHLLKLALAYLLIFGWRDWMPACGLLGSAIAALIAQGTLCCLLLAVFLGPTNAAAFNTRDWRLRLECFYESIQPGLMRAFNRLLSFTSWLAIAYLMTAKGGDYLLVLSIGGTLSFLSQFIGEALIQAQTTVISRLIGAKTYDSVRPAFIAGLLTALVASALLAIPLLAFPYQVFACLFPHIQLSGFVIKQIFWGVWLSSVLFTFTGVPLGHILALRDMKFSVLMGWLSWINGYLWMYWMIQIVQIRAEQFWLVLCVMHLLNAVGYFWRAHRLSSRERLAQAHSW